ncbi:MAG: 30S ribosomal protein S2 [Planctomycetes bacterium]|nr:30S ribosomal protein S2 [Planctomycetota bacterium]
MAIVKMQELLEAGVHFGARTSKWNPKMKPYIFGSRSKVHIIDLRESLRGLIRAYKFLENLTAQNKKVVFVGTKRQAKEVVRSEAKRADQFFVAERWLGGTLTNIRTVRERVARLEELEMLETTGEIQEFSKKMISHINRERKKISRNFEGIREMKSVPGALVLIDPNEEKIALREAMKLNIPTIAIADTDSDPDLIDFLIPANDESFRSIHAILSVLANACISGAGKRKENAMLAARAAGAPGEAPPPPAASPEVKINPSVGAVSFGGDED